MSFADDTNVLRYAGMMGHAICVVGTVNGSRRILGESDDLAFARRLRAEQSDASPTIYRKEGLGWKLTA